MRSRSRTWCRSSTCRGPRRRNRRRTRGLEGVAGVLSAQLVAPHQLEGCRVEDQEQRNPVAAFERHVEAPAMVVEVAEVVVPRKREFAERPGQHVTFVPGDARVQVVRNRELPELVLLGDEPVALVVGDPLGPIVPAVFAVLGKSPKNSKSRSIGGIVARMRVACRFHAVAPGWSLVSPRTAPRPRTRRPEARRGGDIAARVGVLLARPEGAPRHPAIGSEPRGTGFTPPA